MENVNVFHIRLREARKMMHLTMQQLSDGTGGLVSKQSISYYEQGRVAPKASAIAALAKVLDISESYLRGGGAALDEPSLRTSIGTREISEADLSAIKARISFWSERYFIAERRAKLSQMECLPEQELVSKPSVLPIQHQLIATTKDAICAADDMRQAWDIGDGPIPSILRLFERKGIKVMSDTLPDVVWGLSTWASSRHPLVILDMREAKTTVERLRFTAVHELGHLIFDFPEGMEQKQREKLCDTFAGSFLFPRTTMIEEMGTSIRTKVFLEELIDLKELYGISVAALVHNLYDYSIITRQQYDWWYNEIIKKNLLEDGWGRYEFPETLGREKRVRMISEYK